MRTLGIIAEYNPFHNGHLHHLQAARQISGCSHAIAVISGNFTQRGLPAILDKWTRANLAVQSGIDLVLELPFTFAVRSAQDFASGGVRLLDSLGVVEALCFGAEDNNLASLTELATLTSDAATIQKMKQEMKRGISYAAALNRALPQNAIPLNQPNNILAVEYIKAIQTYQATLAPIAVKRKSAQHHDQEINGDIASASAIRQALQQSTSNEKNIKNTLPSHCYTTLQAAAHQGNFPDIAHLNTAILSFLRRSTPHEIASIATISEGLENKLHAAALTSTSINELISTVKSKRYPLTRLQRLLIHCLMRSPKQLFADFDRVGPQYARVLAFNTRGRELLKQLKISSRIPIITKTTTYLSSGSRSQSHLSLLEQMLSFDTYATDLYALCFNPPQAGAQDFIKTPLYIRTTD